MGKLKGNRKMKHQKRDPGSGVSSSRLNISRAMRGKIPKFPNFVILRSQTTLPQYDLPSELVIPGLSASSPPLQQVDPTPKYGKRNRRRQSNHGFESSSAITAPLNCPCRAGDVENYQPPP